MSNNAPSDSSKTVYSCSKCKAPVFVQKNGTIIKTCEHVDESVIASVSAVVSGKSNVVKG